MPFKVFRDQGEWSAYECAPEWGGYRTRAQVEAEVRRLQRQDYEAAETSLVIAKRKLEQAKEAIVAPVKVRLMDSKKPPQEARLRR